MTIPAFSESLWKDGSSLVADQRPDSVGDIVTVAVKENTEAKDEANTEITKDNESNASDGIGIFDFIRKLGFSSSSSMEGDGSTERTHNLTTTVTCIVTEVLPGGNLRLEGRKNIKVQDETMSLKIDGLARPRDVGPDNVIDSDRLANVTVSVDGIGSLSDVQTPGLLTRLFNAIF
jgi:flagellar L-ring protein precursor FlgH